MWSYFPASLKPFYPPALLNKHHIKLQCGWRHPMCTDYASCCDTFSPHHFLETHALSCSWELYNTWHYLDENHLMLWFFGSQVAATSGDSDVDGAISRNTKSLGYITFNCFFSCFNVYLLIALFYCYLSTGTQKQCCRKSGFHWTLPFYKLLKEEGVLDSNRVRDGK